MERAVVVGLSVHSRSRSPFRQRAFTMIELMVAIAILTILMGIGIPAYRSMIADQKVRTAASSLHSALLLARSEAIKLNRTVTLRPADDEGWSEGWLVADPANPDTDASALHRDRLDGDVTVSSGAGSVAFRASGRLITVGSVTFEFEAISDPEKKRCVSIGLDGRATTEQGGC